MALPAPLSDQSGVLRSLSLCAGVGGLELGLRIAEPGYRAVCYVERDSHAASVLVARMADASLCDAPVWDDLTSFDGRQWRGAVDLITAGYPCQPFSSAGKRLAERDPRHLWPHVRRIIKETEPSYVFLENVAGHVDRGFQSVARELRALGFAVEAGLFSAAEVGAPHWRIRLFILAYAHRLHEPQSLRSEGECGGHAVGGSQGPGGQTSACGDGGAELDDVPPPRFVAGMEPRRDAPLPLFPPRPGDYLAWERALKERPDLEPAVHGLDDGLAHRMERYHAVGNGVCPLAAAFAWRALRDRFSVHHP
ncbi:MAG: DNA cytosine methyltransferase [Pseudomonadota bacterium]